MRFRGGARVAALVASLCAGCIVREKEVIREVPADCGCVEAAPCVDAPEPIDTSASDTGGSDSGAADTFAADAPDGSDVSDVSDVADAADVSDACPTPTSEWHVAPNGSDVDGNGAPACPFKTIGRAISAVGSTGAAAKITVHHAGAAATYGDGCTGGAPCDVTPITVPSIITKSLSIAGDGAVADVIVTGGGSSVFLVHAPSVSFAAMSVRPTKTGVANGGGHGFVFDSDAGTLATSMERVTVTGPLATDTAAGMGTAVLLQKKAQLRMSRAILLDGGYHALRVEDTAFGLFNGGVARDVVARSSGAACVKLAGTSSTAQARFNVDTSGAGAAVVEDCGPEGGLVAENGGTAIYGLLITRSGSLVFPGVRVRAGSGLYYGGDVRGLGTDGVLVEGGRIDVDGRITGNTGAGVHILAGGSASGRGEIRANGGDGMKCENGGTVSANNVSIHANGGSGVVVAPTCAASFGINVSFSKTSATNAVSGLCVLGTPTLSVGYAFFSCGYTGAGCAAGTPTRVTSTTCAVGADISAPAGATITTPSVQCCN